MRSSQTGQLSGWVTALLLVLTVGLIGLIARALLTQPALAPELPLPPVSSPSERSPSAPTPAILAPAQPEPAKLPQQAFGTIPSTPLPPQPSPSSLPPTRPIAPLPAPERTPAQQPSVDNQAGIVAYGAGRYQDAANAFERALANQPDNPVIRRNLAAATAALGWAAVEAREADDAIRQFRAAIEFDRTEGSFYAGLGAAYQLRREPQRAIEALQAAVALAPDRTELYEQLAELLYQRNQLDEAIAVLTKGVKRAAQPDRLSASLARITREQSLQSRFLQTGTRHFLLQFDGGENRDVAYQVLDLLELAYRDIGQAFSYFPDEEIVVILYNNEQFRDITQTPSWTKGVYDGKIRLPSGNPAAGGLPDRHLLAKVLYHEYTHAIVHELATNRAPTWLNEGLAVYFERLASGNLEAGERTAGRMKRDTLVPLSSLHGSFLDFSSDQAAVAYAESFDATRFLVERYGLQRVKELLLVLTSNRPFDRAFETTFFLTYPEFERLWQESLIS